jgi:peptide/nickel transport system substrate-binding protein
MVGRLASVVVALVLVAGVLTSCAAPAPSVEAPTPEIVVQTVVVEATPTPEPEAPTGPVAGGTLTIAVDQEPDKLVASWTPLTVSYEISELVNEFLLLYTPELEIVPNLASEVPSEDNGGISADGKTYTFKLRDDVTWHDGEPFTSKDVAFTLEVAADPDSGVRASVPLDSVEMPDDYTLVVHLTAPDAGFLDKMASVFTILPEHTLADVEDWVTAEYLTNPYPGLGAFEFVEWSQGSHVEVEKYPDYFLGEPYLDKIYYRFIPNDDARLTSLATGEVDMIYRIIGEHVPLARSIPEATVYETPAHAWWGATINLEKPIFRDQRTRIALTHAIDKDAIVENVAGGLGTVKWSPFPASNPWYVDVEHKYTYDPARAIELLEEAGWVDMDGDGILEAHGVAEVADGTKFAWQINNIVGQPERLKVCQVLQQYWQDIGAEVTINAVDAATGVGALNAGDFDMAYGWLDVSVEPSSCVFWWRTEGGLNWSNIDTLLPEVEDIIVAADQSLDPAERKALYAEFQELIAEQATDVLLYDRNWYDAVNNRVQNFKPIGAGGVNTWNAQEWWISPS